MPTDTPTADDASRRHLVPMGASWGLTLMVWALLSAMAAFVAQRLPRAERSERGDIAAGLAWALLGVVAAIAIWAVLKQLGLDVVDKMRSALGL